MLQPRVLIIRMNTSHTYAHINVPHLTDSMQHYQISYSMLSDSCVMTSSHWCVHVLNPSSLFDNVLFILNAHVVRYLSRMGFRHMHHACVYTPCSLFCIAALTVHWWRSSTWEQHGYIHPHACANVISTGLWLMCILVLSFLNCLISILFPPTLFCLFVCLFPNINGCYVDMCLLAKYLEEHDITYSVS